MLRICAVLGLSLIALSTAAQNSTSDSTGDVQRGKKASAQYQNLKVLTDIDADELLPAMEAFNAALGVECNFCHVQTPGNLAGLADDRKWQKNIARQMIQTTLDLNRSGVRVSCATCHAGREVPILAPPIMDNERMAQINKEFARERQTPGAGYADFKPAFPGQAPAGAPADAVFAKYEQAIGGEAAIARLTSRVEEGEMTDETGKILTFSLTQKAPDKTLIVIRPMDGDPQRMSCCENGGWRDPGRPGPLMPHMFPAVRLENLFFRDLDLKKQYSKATLLPGLQKLNGKDVQVLEAEVADSHFNDTLYFDNESGLLLRRLTAEQTLFGPIVQQTDFSDYREVAAARVKIPFTIRHTGYAGSDNMRTFTVKRIDFNVPVDDRKFQRFLTVPAALGP